MSITEGGRYAGKVASVEMGETKNGNVCMSIRFDCGESGSLRGDLFFSDNAWEYAAKALLALGWDGEANGWAIEKMIADRFLVGREASLVVEMDEYPVGSGKWHPKVKYINAPGGGVIAERFTPAALADWASNFRAKLGKKAAQKQASLPTDEADIPF